MFGFSQNYKQEVRNLPPPLINVKYAIKHIFKGKLRSH